MSAPDNSHPWDYTGTTHGNLADFLVSLHLQPLQFLSNPPTKIISFHLPRNSLANSGLIEELAEWYGYVDKDSKCGIAYEDLRDFPEMKDFNHLAVGANWLHLFREPPLGYHSALLDPDDVPLAKVWAVYVYMFSVCKNVECIEIPVTWAGFHWYTYFPKITSREGRLVAGDRIRFGKDPEDIVHDIEVYNGEDEEEEEEDADSEISLSSLSEEGGDNEELQSKFEKDFKNKFGKSADGAMTPGGGLTRQAGQEKGQ